MKDDFEFMKYIIIGLALIMIGGILGHNMDHKGKVVKTSKTHKQPKPPSKPGNAKQWR